MVFAEPSFQKVEFITLLLGRSLLMFCLHFGGYLILTSLMKSLHADGRVEDTCWTFDSLFSHILFVTFTLGLWPMLKRLYCIKTPLFSISLPNNACVCIFLWLLSRRHVRERHFLTSHISTSAIFPKS